MIAWWLECSDGVGVTGNTAVILIFQHKASAISFLNISVMNKVGKVCLKECFQSFLVIPYQLHLCETEVKLICMVLFHWNFEYLVLELEGILKRELVFFPSRARELVSLLLISSQLCNKVTVLVASDHIYCQDCLFIVGSQKLDTTERLSTHTHTHRSLKNIFYPYANVNASPKNFKTKVASLKSSLSMILSFVYYS